MWMNVGKWKQIQAGVPWEEKAVTGGKTNLCGDTAAGCATVSLCFPLVLICRHSN